ncbi:MAG: PilZ domain-containing protein, partial [Candidatus Omnitrophota bacterium]
PIDVNWTMPGEDSTGQGQILNISSSGVLLQIDNSFRPLDECVLSIDPEITEQKLPFLNKKGKVVWFRRTKNPHYCYQCGVEFLGERVIDQDFNTWLETKSSELSQAMGISILNNYVA